MIRKTIIVLLTFGALGTSALWIMSHLHWPCAWAHDGTAGRYLYRVGHSDCLTGPFLSPPSWFLLARAPSDDWSTKNLALSQGIVSFEWFYSVSLPPGTAPPANKRIRLVGFGFERTRSTTWTGRYTRPKIVDSGVNLAVRVPLWALVGALSCYPAIAFIRGPVRCWRWQRRGFCVACGYDLTANLSGICPECGTEINR